MVKEIETKEEFVEVVGGDKYVVVDFTATWCGPCRMIGPEFEKIAETVQKVVCIKVDVDKNAGASEMAGISCMPTFQVWKDGEKVEEFSGASKDKLKALVDKYEAM